MTDVHMLEIDLPLEWGDGHRLHELLCAALVEGDCPWLQTACGAGFLFACVIEAEERVDYRTAVATKVCEMIMTVARTGEMPRGRMQ